MAPTIAATTSSILNGYNPSGTVSLPTGFTNGDLALVIIESNRDVALNTPANWVELYVYRETNNSRWLQVFGRIATGALGGTETFGWTGHFGGFAATAHRITGASSVLADIKFSATSVGASSVNCGVPSSIPSDPLVLRVVGGKRANYTPPAGLTQLGNPETDASTNVELVVWSDDDNSTESITVSINNNYAQGITIAVASNSVSADVAPATIASVGTIGAPTPIIGADVTPATITSTGTIPAPTPIIGATVTPATVASVGSIQTPSVIASSDVGPATVTSIGAIGTPGASSSVLAGQTLWFYDGSAGGAYRTDVGMGTGYIAIEFLVAPQQTPPTGSYQTICAQNDSNSSGDNNLHLRFQNTTSQIRLLVSEDGTTWIGYAVDLATLGYTSGLLHARVTHDPATGTIQWQLPDGAGGWTTVETDTYTPGTGARAASTERVAVGAASGGGQDITGFIGFVRATGAGDSPLWSFDAADTTGWTLTGAGSYFFDPGGPATVASVGTVIEPVAVAGTVVAPATVASVGSVQAPSVVVAADVAPATVASVGSVPAPTAGYSITAGASHVFFPGAASGGGRAYRPDVDLPLGDIEIEWSMAMPSWRWDPSDTSQGEGQFDGIISQDAGDNRNCWLRWAYGAGGTGQFQFSFSTDGTNVTNHESGAVAGPVNGNDQFLRFKLTHVTNNGAGAPQTDFYRWDEPTQAWVLLNTVTTGTAYAQRFASTSDVVVGAVHVNSHYLRGAIEHIVVRDGVGGAATVVFDPDDLTGWTLVPGAALVTVPGPTTVTSVGTVTTPTATVGVDVAPATIASLSTFPTPTFSVGGTLTPATIASVSTFPAPTAEVRATPPTIASVGTINAPDPVIVTTIEPATIASASTVPAPAIVFTAEPATIASVSTFPTATVSEQGGPTTIASVSTFGTPSIPTTGGGGTGWTTLPSGYDIIDGGTYGAWTLNPGGTAANDPTPLPWQGFDWVAIPVAATGCEITAAPTAAQKALAAVERLSVRMRVWFPSLAELRASDNALHDIFALGGGGSGDQGGFVCRIGRGTAANAAKLQMLWRDDAYGGWPGWTGPDFDASAFVGRFVWFRWDLDNITGRGHGWVRTDDTNDDEAVAWGDPNVADAAAVTTGRKLLDYIGSNPLRLLSGSGGGSGSWRHGAGVAVAVARYDGTVAVDFNTPRDGVTYTGGTTSALTGQTWTLGRAAAASGGLFIVRRPGWNTTSTSYWTLPTGHADLVVAPGKGATLVVVGEQSVAPTSWSNLFDAREGGTLKGAVLYRWYGSDLNASDYAWGGRTETGAASSVRLQVADGGYDASTPQVIVGRVDDSLWRLDVNGLHAESARTPLETIPAYVPYLGVGWGGQRQRTLWFNEALSDDEVAALTAFYHQAAADLSGTTHRVVDGGGTWVWQPGGGLTYRTAGQTSLAELRFNGHPDVPEGHPAVTPGERFTASVALDAGPSPTDVQLVLDFRDANGRRVGYAVEDHSCLNGGGLLTVDGVAPTNAAYVALRALIYPSGWAGVALTFARPYLRRKVGTAIIDEAAIVDALIANASISRAKIAEAAIGTAQIGDAAIVNAHIGDAQITNAKIANLDAGKITTGTLDADRIAAGSITTAKLIVGSFDNLAQDPLFSLGSGTSFADSPHTAVTGGGTWSFDATRSRGGGRSLRFTHTGWTANASINVNGSGGSPEQHPVAMEGDEFVFGIWVYPTGTARPTFFATLGWWNGGAWLANTTTSLTAAQLPANQWSYVEVSGTAPANTTHVTPTFGWYYDGAKDVDAWHDGAYLRRRVGSALIEDAAIVRAKIAEAAIGSLQVEDGAITNAKIGNAQIDGAKIALASIGTAHIETAAITRALIASAAIGSAEIANGSINTAHIGTLVVDGAWIADATIASAKIASLDAGKITTGTLSASRIAAGSLTADKLTTGTLSAATITLASGAVLKSSNYSTGSAGWSINAAGDAEFNNLTVRGTIANASVAGGHHIDLSSTGYIGSTNYAAGSTGWRIKGDGTAEFNNVTVRGTIYATAGSFSGSLSGATGTFSGSLSAASGTFTGTVSAGTVSGGSVSGASISGGSISIGGNFSVNSSGVLSASGADVSGTITASTLTAGNWSSGNGLYISGSGFFQIRTSYSTVNLAAGGGGSLGISGGSYGGSIGSQSGGFGIYSGSQVEIHAGYTLSIAHNGNEFWARIPDSAFVSANVHITNGGGGHFYRATSSIRAKTGVVALDREIALDRIRRMRATSFQSVLPFDVARFGAEHRANGFIVEELAEISPTLVHWEYPNVEEELHVPVDVEHAEPLAYHQARPDTSRAKEATTPNYNALLAEMLTALQAIDARLLDVEAALQSGGGRTR